MNIMMTLDDAINHAEEVAKFNREFEPEDSLYPLTFDEYIDKKIECDKCAKEHEQLAKWLKDYKRLLQKQERKKIIEIKEDREINGTEIKYQYLRYKCPVCNSDVQSNFTCCPMCETKLYAFEEQLKFYDKE